MHNGPYWAAFIRDVFLRQVGAFRDAVFGRLLPSFAGIGEEAEEHAEEVWERFGRHAGPDSDPAAAAEAAHEAGVDRYLLLNDVRQSFLNMSVVALRHLLEQQQVILLRRALFPRAEQDKDIHNVSDEFSETLQAADINPTTYESWAELEVLELAANAIKHAEGRSAKRLRELRRDLLIHPGLREDRWSRRLVEVMSVDAPLAGEDIFVAEADLAGFFEAVESFWESLAVDLEASS